MSVSMWSYRPEVCDGGGCPGDCDLCDKPKNMEDEDEDMSDDMRLFVDSLSYMATRGQMRKSMENGSDIHLCLYAEDEGEEMLLDLGKAPQEIINEVFYYDD